MDERLTFEFARRPAIEGAPELCWPGKRPLRSAQYYPARLREAYGARGDGWANKLFWGDNLQVMGHLLADYRGQIDLIYIDPPFDSGADYKKTIEARGAGTAETDGASFEEKQYGDIWPGGEYLQFIYERLILMRELLSEKGSIFMHCDWHKNHHLRCLMDEVFGPGNFVNEIAWCYYGPGSPGMRRFNRKHDIILWYSKTANGWKFNADAVRVPHDEKTGENFKRGLRGSGFAAGKYDLADGKIPEDWWEIAVAGRYPNDGVKRVGYPTEKPFKLLERIIGAATDEGDLVADFFMGSGVTQMCAMRMGRRFIGADVNLGAVQVTTKRLLSAAARLQGQEGKYTGFEVYHVNDYDLFRSPVEARERLMEALGIRPFPRGDVWDGELDGRKVKILPVDRAAAQGDLKGLLANLPYGTYEKRKKENPGRPVERVTIVCMGHEPGLREALERELSAYPVDVQLLDILRDRADLQIKGGSRAEIVLQGGELIIRAFRPADLTRKLPLPKNRVEDWRRLVDSVMIDWNYDGAVLRPALTDIPGKNGLVSGIYHVPENAGTIRVKITDLLSESLEVEVH